MDWKRSFRILPKGTGERVSRRHRSLAGATLTELMVAAVLLGFCMAVIGELLVAMTITSVRVTNKSDVLSSARTATSRIIQDVRSAAAFGDLAALPTQRNIFPADYNPVYGSTYGSAIPSGGWPSSPWPNTPYSLSGQCLIVQQPVVFTAKVNHPADASYDSSQAQDSRNGLPMWLNPSDIGVGQPIAKVLNVDTVVYCLVADPDRVGEYQLQMARFPGYPKSITSGYWPIINPPQTIAKGIIGPKPIGAGSSTPPEIFRYYVRDDVSTSPTYLGVKTTTIPNTPTATEAAKVIGVIVDLELHRPDVDGPSTTNHVQNVGIRAEGFKKILNMN